MCCVLFFVFDFLSLRSPLNWFIKRSRDGDSRRRRPTNRFCFTKYRITIRLGVLPLSLSPISVAVTLTEWDGTWDLRACPCKNRPLKFSWKMDCLHFFHTSQPTYAMDENGIYFDRFAFLIFLRIFFVGTPKTTQTWNWNPKNWGLRYACSNFAHSMKQPNSFRITA